MPVHAVSSCRFATPTLFLPWPLWYAASASEWSCTRLPESRQLADPSECARCKCWERAEHAAGCRCHECHQDDHLGSVAP